MTPRSKNSPEKKKKRSSPPTRAASSSSTKWTSTPSPRRPRLPRQDQVEVVPLGKQPILEPVYGAMDKQGRPMRMYRGKVKEQFEYRAKGKAVRELVGMADKTIERNNELVAQAEDRFGFDRITAPDGSVKRLRLDEIEELRYEKHRGYGRTPVRPMFLVPEIPWKDPSAPKRHGKTKIRYVAGERIEEFTPF